eukprot:2662243-Lingulodinium_polyedra.AAC.1
MSSANAPSDSSTRKFKDIASNKTSRQSAKSKPERLNFVAHPRKHCPFNFRRCLNLGGDHHF